MVCSNWNSSSKLSITRKIEPPWLMLFPEEGNVCALYNPDEDRVYYRTNKDLSGIRFLANSGKWFLVVDSRSNLYIIDTFSDNRINLPPLESFLSTIGTIKRVGDEEFEWEANNGIYSYTLTSDFLRGVLWVDEKTEGYVVVCFFDCPASFLSLCKKGNDYFTDVPLRVGVPTLLQGLTDLVLRGYCLYILTARSNVRVLDLSGEKGFVDITGPNPFKTVSPRNGYSSDSTIAVTTAGEVLFVESITTESQRRFYIYKNDPNLVEVGSLGDEALILDLGFTVPANHTLGIEPNSIYSTRHHRACHPKPYNLDICVFNLETKILKHFPLIANMNLNDARWFLPST